MVHKDVLLLTRLEGGLNWLKSLIVKSGLKAFTTHDNVQKLLVITINTWTLMAININTTFNL